MSIITNVVFDPPQPTPENSMRVDDEIARLLTVASYALEANELGVVERSARQVLLLDPESIDAKRYLEAAGRVAEPDQSGSRQRLDPFEVGDRLRNYWERARGPLLTVGALALPAGTFVVQAIREEWTFLVVLGLVLLGITAGVVLLVARRERRALMPVLLGLWLLVTLIAIVLVVVQHLGVALFGGGFTVVLIAVILLAAAVWLFYGRLRTNTVRNT